MKDITEKEKKDSFLNINSEEDIVEVLEFMRQNKSTIDV